eukprot:TRINITY_DN48021_c0_g1_i1.p1 TRINITY_DN48021_c0_g1~~TRINITY_DN48021_c0_g1_i1.p1  ORF type:complete len:467 (+),score=56.86 TRINITY_DN48021_c0_g1_i1:47-1447(+)
MANGGRQKQAWKDVTPNGLPPPPPGEDHGSEERSLPRTVLVVAMWAATGLAEGFMMVKCMVVYPKVVADAWACKNFVMLKVLLSAVGSSLLSQSALCRIAPDMFYGSRIHGRYRYGYGRIVFGLAFVGIGMGVCGSGHDMIAPSMGAQIRMSPFLLLGAFSGAFLVGVAEALLRRTRFSLVVMPLQCESSSGCVQRCVAERRVPEQSRSYEAGSSDDTPGHALDLEEPQAPANEAASSACTPRRAEEGERPPTFDGLCSKLLKREVSYEKVAVPAGALCLLSCVALEVLVDFSKDVGRYFPAWEFSSPAWPPTLLGVVVGLAQIPVRIIHGEGRNSIGSFMTLGATVTCDSVFKGTSLQAAMCCVFKGWHFLYGFLFIMAGGILASWSWTTWKLRETDLVEGFSPLQSFLGMFLATLGALVAGGCMYGHAISGVSELSLESLLGVIVMLSSATATRYLLPFTGIFV